MKNDPTKPSCDALINLFPDPFVIIDPTFHIVAANQKYRDHYNAWMAALTIYQYKKGG